jgi:hypothetical protein
MVVRCAPEITANIVQTQRARAALRGLSVLVRLPGRASILFVDIGPARAMFFAAGV